MSRTIARLGLSLLLGAIPLRGLAQEEADERFATDDVMAPAADPPAGAQVHVHRIDPACPAPTRTDKGGKCVLDADVELDSAIDLASFTTLNCKGHVLRPKLVGVSVPAYAPSVPEVAILVHDAHGVKIQNCVVRDVDFGVVVAEAKWPESAVNDPAARALLRTQVLANELTVRVGGVLVVHADGTQIADNTVTLTTSAGGGIVLLRDADDNLVNGNTVLGSDSPAVASPLVPGDAQRGTSQVGLATFNPPQNLYNLRVGGLLLQFPNRRDAHNEDNVFTGNTVTLLAPGTGIDSAVRSIRPVIDGNRIVGGNLGISGGFPRNADSFYPGTCSDQPTFYCVADADCDTGATCSRTCKLDAGQTCTADVDCPGTGPCIVGSYDTIDGGVYDGIIENNTFQGPFVSTSANPGRAMQLGNQVNLTVRGNTLDGAGSTPRGIWLRVRALETTTITRNIIKGFGVALVLERGPGANAATHFGSSIFLNDFKDNTARVGLLPGYPTSDPAFLTELSVGGQGNFWDHTCPDGGFLVPVDSPSSAVRDSHPYGQSVALTPDDLLPPPCF
jgi:hypothetical protein